MQSIFEILLKAFVLLFNFDLALWEIIFTSFRVSLTALLFTTPIAFTIAWLLSTRDFIARRLVIAIFNTLLSFPTVVVGLTLYILLSNHGPFANLQLLFTQTAMILGQIILALPILVVSSLSSLQELRKEVYETAVTLNVGRFYTIYLIFREVKFGLIAGILIAFSRIISEVGASMMLGGNILHYTRSITTSIALETSKGEFAQGIALGIVLLSIAFLLNILLQFTQGKGQQR